MPTIDRALLKRASNTKPRDRDALWNWIYLHSGLRFARRAVCCGHHAPYDALACWQLERPTQALLLGPRGGGKSFMSGVSTHMDSRWFPRHSTRILGGSEAQARQIYNAIDEAVVKAQGPAPFHLTDKDAIRVFGKEISTYWNDSDVQVLAASQKNARGPHVPALKLDEVDEIDPEIRESAMGMNMDKHGYSATCIMTSTWHNLGGSMGMLIDAAKEQGWPFHHFCMFEVLETCPGERSGPYVGGEALYEKCPECPLKKWCHSERDRNGDRALAKMSAGHYGIDALIQKTATVSLRIFEADYLCRGPKADGLWFTNFRDDLHVTEAADYDPRFSVHFALDTGVRTGAVWFQVRVATDRLTGKRTALVNVFADYFAEHLPPSLHVHGVHTKEKDAPGINDIARLYCGGRVNKLWTDPAGKARNASGTVTVGEYLAAGLPLEAWPKVSVIDALTLVEGLLQSASGEVYLTIHPRCKHLINALRTYRRAKVKGMYVDWPDEPQHPAENLIDPLKNGLVAVIGPTGLAPEPVHGRVPLTSVF